MSIDEIIVYRSAGIHTGECETADGKAAGIAVVIAARVMAQAAASQILTTSTVKDLVAGSGLISTPAGAHELKGIPGTWPFMPPWIAERTPS
jgi:class 3 adenylate cyclase